MKQCSFGCYKILSIKKDPSFQERLSGLGVWLALRVRQVLGSNPGWAQQLLFFLEPIEIMRNCIETRFALPNDTPNVERSNTLLKTCELQNFIGVSLWQFVWKQMLEYSFITTNYILINTSNCVIFSKIVWHSTQEYQKRTKHVSKTSELTRPCGQNCR